MPGFVPKPRTREVVCDWIEAEEGSDPLTATIRANLTFAEIDYINGLFGKDAKVTYAEAFEIVAPNVIAWNAMALDRESGEYVAVPPPAEGGADSLRAVDALITDWLLWSLGQSHRGGAEREGKSQPSGDTPATDGDAS